MAEDSSRGRVGVVILLLLLAEARPFGFDTAVAQARIGRSQAGGNSATVQLPSGLFSIPQSMATSVVQTGETLVLQGQPAPDNSSAAASQWQLARDSVESLFNLQPGSRLVMSDVALLDVELGPGSSDSAVLLPPLPQLAAPNASASLLLQRVTLVLSNCSALRQLQNRQCRLQLADSDGSSPEAEVAAEWLMVWHLAQPGLELHSCVLTCKWPPPPLASSSSSASASPSTSDATPLWQHPAFNASFVRVARSGALEPGSLLPAPPLDPAAAGDSSGWGVPLACVSRRVGDRQEVERALVELQAVSGQVVLQLVRNISLASAPYSAANSSQAAEQWPGPGRALRLYRNVTLLGKRVRRLLATISIMAWADVELDFDLQRFTLYLDNTSAAQLHLVNLVLANTPTGPRHAFPNNVLLASMWAVASDRRPTAPLSMRMMNCTLVCPDDLFDYTLYWIGLAASPVPSISILASWQTTLALQGNLEFRNDSQKLRVQQRDGQGITWSRMAVTDEPFWSPRRLQRTGVSALVPGDPLYPWAKITPIFNEEQLVLYLQAPSNPYAILFANITLTPDAIKRAASNPYPQAGVPLEQNATNATEQQARAAQQQLQAAGGQLVVSSSLTLLGDWERPTVLDLGGAAGLVQLGGAGNQRPRVGLQRLILSGLGPAGPNQFPPGLINFTVNLWAFQFDRPQAQLVLDNTTLLLPEPELAFLRSLMALGNVSQVNAAAERLGGAMRPFVQNWASVYQLPGSAPGHVTLGSLTFNGLQTSNTSLVEQLPFQALGLNLTALPQNLVLGGPEGPSLADLAAGKQLASAETRKSWQPWQVGVLAAGCCVALFALAAAGFWVARRQLSAQQLSAQKLAAQQLASEWEKGKTQQPPMSPKSGSLTAMSSGLNDLPGLPPGTQATHRLSAQHSLQTTSASTRPDGAGTSGGQPSSMGSIAPSLSAPDDEIRQLVSAQRNKKRSAVSGCSAGTGFDLDGVQLDEVLGQGSYGVVYRGRWRGMTVAVKALVFHDAGPSARRARQRAINEAAINTLLSHDCICNMYAYDLRPMAATGLPDDKFSAHYRLYIIQEYCDAGSLAHAIDSGLFHDVLTGTRKLPQLLQVALDIAQGLAYIHSKDVIHGDLSSGNIMLRSDPSNPLGVQAKVCDFGLSRFLEGPDQSHISNARQGTPYYMAPEVLAHGLMSREADAFSFGVILWELFHVQPPPWRDPEVLRAATERLKLGKANVIIPPKAMVAALQEVGPSVSHTMAASSSCLPEDGATGSVMLPRPMLLLDATNPSGFTYPLPPGCPQAYADLVAACIHPIPKVRPRLSEAVEALVRLQRTLGLTSVVRGEGCSVGQKTPQTVIGASQGQQGVGHIANAMTRLASTPVLLPGHSQGACSSEEGRAGGPMLDSGLVPILPRATSTQGVGTGQGPAGAGLQGRVQEQGMKRACSAMAAPVMPSEQMH
ncbi:hypothetical protein V8C86DRAFT_2587039 [Haematococcus lacustris]